MTVLLAVSTGVCVWKGFKACQQKVAPDCAAIVFQYRRRKVLYTTEDNMRLFPDPNNQRNKHNNAAKTNNANNTSMFRRLSRALHLQTPSHIFVPPLTSFGVFTVPAAVFDIPGEAVPCLMNGVRTTDGSVRISLRVFYCIPFEDLDRYLAAVGPKAPNEIIAIAAAQVLRAKSAGVSVGILLSRSRRDGLFMTSFRDTLSTKLMSEAAIELCDIIVDKVEALED